MEQNFTAINALEEYVKIEKPGYAFMIEAPWGAGKTHLVNSVFSDHFSKDTARYISLNGISDRQSFRKALIEGTPGATYSRALRIFGNLLGRITKTGDLGDLANDKLEDILIKEIPDIIIFDDVERCELRAIELLGLINEFVEHMKKRVILCAFIDRRDDNETEKRDLFLKRKEKVVGRTVKISADLKGALPTFISEIPNGQGKQWLKDQEKLLLEIFESAKHNNLRVFRQCLNDCARTIDIFEEDIFNSKDALVRFVRTYFALSMDLILGEIKPSDLSDRGNYKCIIKPEPKDEERPLYNCHTKYPQAEIFAGDSSCIIPVELGISLIGIGYEAPKIINETLRNTAQFTTKSETPLWRHAFEWHRMSRDKLELLHKQAIEYIFSTEEIQPGPYIHLAYSVLKIANLSSENADEIAEKIVNRVRELAQKGKIPAAICGHGLGWSTLRDDFLFGGYIWRIDKNTKLIIDAMRETQIASFKKSIHDEVERLTFLFKTDLDKFGSNFGHKSGEEKYKDAAIILHINTCSLSELIYIHLSSGNSDAVGSQMKLIASLFNTCESEKENRWAQSLHTELINIASSNSPLEKARMALFLEAYWNFPNDMNVAS